MSFQEFSAACAAHNLVARDCGNGHWRVEKGKVEVNYYPTSKKKTIYVNGTHGAIYSGGTPLDAIKVALGEVEGKLGAKTHRRGGTWTRRTKRRLLAVSDVCHYCPEKLNFETITIDHRIPLSRGGSNYFDNLVGACKKCNTEKGSNLEIPKKESVV
jgi:hypothetical protein